KIIQLVHNDSFFLSPHLISLGRFIYFSLFGCQELLTGAESGSPKKSPTASYALVPLAAPTRRTPNRGIAISMPSQIIEKTFYVQRNLGGLARHDRRQVGLFATINVARSYKRPRRVNTVGIPKPNLVDFKLISVIKKSSRDAREKR